MDGSATPAVMCISQEEGGEAWPPSKRPEKEKPERGGRGGAERGTASASHLSSLKKQAEGKNTGCQWLWVHLSGCRHGNLIRRPIGWRQGLVRDATDRSSKTVQRWRLERDCRQIASAGVIWEEREVIRLHLSASQHSTPCLLKPFLLFFLLFLFTF